MRLSAHVLTLIGVGLWCGLAGVLTRAAEPPGGQFAAPSTVRVAGIVLKWLRADKEANYRRVVHPAEFLVTSPEGIILQQTILGHKLLISAGEVGTDADANRVFYFDLPLPGIR